MFDDVFDYESIDDVRTQIAKLCRAGVYDGMDVYGMQKDLVEKFIEYAEDSLSNDNIRDASIALGERRSANQCVLYMVERDDPRRCRTLKVLSESL